MTIRHAKDFEFVKSKYAIQKVKLKESSGSTYADQNPNPDHVRRRNTPNDAITQTFLVRLTESRFTTFQKCAYRSLH